MLALASRHARFAQTAEAGFAVDGRWISIHGLLSAAKAIELVTAPSATASLINDVRARDTTKHMNTAFQSEASGLTGRSFKSRSPSRCFSF
jgi:hypothetical protein